jgi:hypothetical protein
MMQLQESSTEIMLLGFKLIMFTKTNIVKGKTLLSFLSSLQAQTVKTAVATEYYMIMYSPRLLICRNNNAERIHDRRKDVNEHQFTSHRLLDHQWLTKESRIELPATCRDKLLLTVG